MNKTLISLICLVFVFGIFFSFAPIAKAATINVPGDYATIAEAVTAASNGDTINIAAGTFNLAASITINGKNNLTLEGAGDNQTIVNGGGGLFAALDITNCANIKIDGLDIKNAEIGITALNSSGIISHNKIEDINVGEEPTSGGIALDSSTFDVFSNSITTVTGTDFSFGIIADGSNTNIYRNDIRGNMAGIIFAGENNYVFNNTVVDNDFFGIGCVEASGSIYGNLVSDNAGPIELLEIGSGVFGFGCNVEIYANKISNNRGFFGSGITLFGSLPQSPVYNNYIANNTVTGFGGGVLSFDDPSPIYNNTIINNQAQGELPTPTTTPSVKNKSLETLLKTGLDGMGAKVTAEANKIKPRMSDFKESARAQFGDGGPGEELGGGVVIFNDTENHPALYNNIIWGNTDDVLDLEGGTSFTYSDIEEGYSGEGNINSDPKLSGYALTSGSPAIDAGTRNGAPPADINGSARPQNNGIDMGAYEYGALPQTGANNIVPTNANNSPQPNYALIIILTAPLSLIYFLARRLKKNN